jgi:arsenate reductase (thioredoxin)
MGLFGKKQEKYVLFACIENAGRSQMAEGFFRKYAQRDMQQLVLEQNPRQR